MNVCKRPIAAALLLLTALTITTFAQQKRQSPAKTPPKAAVAPTPAPTFDTLVPAETYTIYGEIRGVGQLVKSNALTEIIEPILKIAGPPKEFRTFVKWLNAHSDQLMTSRLLVATWPRAKEVPEALIAIEFASAEEAAKFATPLNEILPTVVPSVVEPAKEGAADKSKPSGPPKPDYHLQQVGSLILLTQKPLSFKTLKPAGSKLLAEDNNFRAARNRFNSEPVFVFLDIKSIERQEEERRKHYEQAQREEAETVKKEQAANEEKSRKSEEPAEPESTEPAKAPVVEEQRQITVLTTRETLPPDPVSSALSSLASSFFGGESDWPDAVGLALSIENDSIDIRALLINQAGEKSDVVPFMPALIPGPAFVPESPNILPADTELFVTMSLDLPQIYSTMSKPQPNSQFYTSRGNVQTVTEVVHESPFAAIEKRLKLNLKDDLLPLLGSEISIRLPLTGLDFLGLPRGPMVGAPESTKKQAPGNASPVVLISLKDKEAVRALMPKIIDSLGFEGASSLLQTERREDTEIVSAFNLFSYAFIGNFLVLSGDPATTRHVVDSYLKHETLASDSQYKNFTRWQPRPAHGQLYISPALMENYKSWAEQPTMRVSDQTRAYLVRLSEVAQPITYSLSNEGFGPLHELHLPKNLIQMLVAGLAGEANPSPALQNERMAIGLMYTIALAQDQFKSDKGNGSYGSLEQLIAAELVSKEMVDNSGYRFDLTFSPDKFEVSGVPLEYGKKGNMSYFIDQTRMLRGADRNGASATSSDPQIR